MFFTKKYKEIINDQCAQIDHLVQHSHHMELHHTKMYNMYEEQLKKKDAEIARLEAICHTALNNADVLNVCDHADNDLISLKYLDGDCGSITNTVYINAETHSIFDSGVVENCRAQLKVCPKCFRVYAIPCE